MNETPATPPHTGTIGDVTEYLRTATGATTKSQRNRVRVATSAVLSRIADQPGTTWAHKWVNAGDVSEAWFRAQLASTQPDDPALTSTHRAQLAFGLQLLITHHIIRPSLLLLLHPEVSRYVTRMIAKRNRHDLDRLLAGATSTTQVTTSTAKRITKAAAAMIAFTGKPLTDITVDEWVTAERYRRECAALDREWRAALASNPDAPKPLQAADYRHTISLTSAYAGARQSGLITPRAPQPGLNPLPATLDHALTPPATLDTWIASHGKDLPPRVRALAYDTYSLDGEGLDSSTIRVHIGSLNSYMKAIRTVLPGHDSLHLPLEHRDHVFRILSLTSADLKTRGGRQRQSLGNFLGRLRSIYRMANGVTQRYELTQHLDVIAAFPWSPTTIRKIVATERARSRTTLHTTVRAHIAHLDGLVEAAHDLSARSDTLRDIARSTTPGDTFTHDGITYRRALHVKGPAVGTGAPHLTIYEDGNREHRHFDAEKLAYSHAQAKTLTILLRDTGMRIEEVSELQVTNVDMIQAGNTTIPTITVNPSKMDRARIVGLTPMALTALHDLITRTRERYGHDPHATRIDWHENTEQPPAPLIFHTISRRVHVGPSRDVFVRWLNTVVNHYNQHFHPTVPLPPVTPHQMRRLFATDLGERGADVIAIQQTLGHAVLSTTGIYMHLDETQAIAEITQARRRARQD